MYLPHRYENIGSAVLIPTKRIRKHIHTHIKSPIWCLSVSWQFSVSASLLISVGFNAQFVTSTQSVQHRLAQACLPLESLRVSRVVLPADVLSFGDVRWKPVVFICTCARRTLSHTPYSWHNSTSGKRSRTFPFAFQSWCCDLCRSRGGRSHLYRAMSGCRPDLGYRRNPSADWGHRNWVRFHNKPDLVLLGAWSSCTWVSGFPPIHGTRGVFPPPSPTRCRTCPSCSRQ